MPGLWLHLAVSEYRNMDLPLNFIALAGVAVLIFEFIGRMKMMMVKKEGFSTVGKVIDYEDKFVRVAGSWTWLEYPIIDYKDRKGNTQTGYIKFAKNNGRYFSIGQEVDVIIYGETIYYRGAMPQSKMRLLAIALIIVGLGYEIYN